MENHLLPLDDVHRDGGKKSIRKEDVKGLFECIETGGTVRTDFA